MYSPFNSWAANSDWQVSLPEGEEATAVAAGQTFCAVATSRRMLRLFSQAGQPALLLAFSTLRSTHSGEGPVHSQSRRLHEAVQSCLCSACAAGPVSNANACIMHNRLDLIFCPVVQACTSSSAVSGSCSCTGGPEPLVYTRYTIVLLYDMYTEIYRCMGCRCMCHKCMLAVKLLQGRTCIFVFLLQYTQQSGRHCTGGQLVSILCCLDLKTL